MPFPSELGCEFRVCLFHSKFLNCVFMPGYFSVCFQFHSIKGPCSGSGGKQTPWDTHKPELYPAKQDLLSYLLLAVQI